MGEDQQAEIEWGGSGDVPVSKRFEDPYYSLEDGWAESTHVFVAGNQLLGRLRPGFHVAELGFGTGLNLLALVAAALAVGAGGPIHFTSFEAYPMNGADMDRALAAFPGAHSLAAPMLAARSAGQLRWTLGPVSAELIVGDARMSVAEWTRSADAWFLDGFAPARNPELWEPELMAEVGRHTRAGGTFATYTAAGRVRRALAAAGFVVERPRGFGRKRHMSVGRLP